MKTSKKLIVICLIAFTIILAVACSSSNSSANRKSGIFKVLEDDTTVEMDGDITTSSLDDFKKLLNEFPKIKQITIINCGGSLDDEANLKLSKLVHDKKIGTHVADNGMIASGGVDFFLAGVKRTIGKNVQIGVHSWSGEKEVATDFPKGHENHLEYINYYKSIGLTQKQAEDFYYFTIYSAPADGIHIMTEKEIETYNMITN